MRKRLLITAKAGTVLPGVLILLLSVVQWTQGQGSPEILWTKAQHSERINGVAFNSDGSMLASGSSDRLIKLWNSSDGTLIRTINENAPAVHESAVECVAFSPDNTQIAWPTYQQVYIARVSDGTIRSFRLPNRTVAHDNWAITVAFSPDGTRLASTSFDGTVNIWNVSTLALVRTLRPDSGQMRAADFSPDGRYLATAGGGSYTVQLWNTSDWSLARELGGEQKHNNDIWWVAFSPDGTKLASASEDTTAKIWQISTGALLHTLDRHTGRVYSLDFSADGSMLATVGTGDNTIRLWRVSDGTQSRIYDQNTAEVNTIAISRNNIMAYGRTDNTLVVARLNGTGTVTPTVTLISPAHGSSFTSPATVTLSASVSSPVTKVEFFHDLNKLGEDSSAPFSFSWSGVPAGNYWVRAIATTSQGSTVSSTSINLTVTNTAGSNPPPTVSLTAPSPSAFRAPASITIAASATAQSGIQKVEFYSASTKIGEDTTAPYGMVWSSVPAGQYRLKAVAYSLAGPTATSAEVLISVTNAPASGPGIQITQPLNESSFTTGAIVNFTASASSTSASITRVEFFEGPRKMGEDVSAPFNATWPAGVAGEYFFTARVFDSSGNSNISTAVRVTVNEPVIVDDTTPPRLTITSPANGLRTASQAVVVQGTSSDNISVAQVRYQLNGGAPVTVAGTAVWETTITLSPGLNRITMQALDNAGNVSVTQNRDVTYVPSDVLILRATVGGLISPNLDGRLLPRGNRYTVSAIPTSGYLFDGWTGSLSSTVPRLTFVMAAGLELEANFIPNPFLSRKGSYVGLVQNSPRTHENSGFLTLNLSGAGTFSARLLVGGRAYSFTGRFSNQGLFTRIIRTAVEEIQLTLQLDVVGSSDRITGTVGKGGVTSEIAVDRAVFHSRNNPYPAAGGYTVLMPAGLETPENVPQSPGYGFLTLDSSGRARFSGTLGEGTRVSQGTIVSKNQEWPFQGNLYANKGSISGKIVVLSTAETDLDGEVVWQKPLRPLDRYYPEGFAITASILGSRYRAPLPGTPVIQPSIAESTPLVIGSGNLVNPFLNQVVFLPNNRVTVITNEAPQLGVSVSPSSGLLSGRFFHPAKKTITSFRGVVFQKQNLGSGHFLGTSQSGYFLLNASE